MLMLLNLIQLPLFLLLFFYELSFHLMTCLPLRYLTFFSYSLHSNIFFLVAFFLYTDDIVVNNSIINFVCLYFFVHLLRYSFPPHRYFFYLIAFFTLYIYRNRIAISINTFNN